MLIGGQQLEGLTITAVTQRHFAVIAFVSWPKPSSPVGVIKIKWFVRMPIIQSIIIYCVKQVMLYTDDRHK